MQDFVTEARDAGAVVFNAVQGGIGEDGTLQSYLEFCGVPFTGGLVRYVRQRNACVWVVGLQLTLQLWTRAAVSDTTLGHSASSTSTSGIPGVA